MSLSTVQYNGFGCCTHSTCLVPRTSFTLAHVQARLLWSNAQSAAPVYAEASRTETYMLQAPCSGHNRYSSEHLTLPHACRHHGEHLQLNVGPVARQHTHLRRPA
jgi:hypothetical protein